VSATLRDTAPAKINLTLRVVGRRADGYHNLESLVAFADLADELTLEPAGTVSLDVTGPFSGQCGPPDDNLVLKAARELGLPAGRFILDKHIPVAAGLGGGSADAAAALRLIAQLNGIALDDERMTVAAAASGADVPVCLRSEPCVMRGIGDDLSAPIALPRLPALLVNPGIPLATRDVFGALRPVASAAEPIADIPSGAKGLLAWLAARGNDLTDASTALAPEIGGVLGELAVQDGCRLSRMSGSGATCFGLFETASNVRDAANRLSAKHRNWWICPVTLG
jgi:4-diphosphocytidyl-2-C-methyl-D-erythritol kinase